MAGLMTVKLGRVGVNDCPSLNLGTLLGREHIMTVEKVIARAWTDAD